MTLYIKGKVFYWWKDQFTVKDESGQEKYHTAWKRQKLSVYNTGHEEVASAVWQPRQGCFQVFAGGREVAEVAMKFTFLRFFRPRVFIKGLDWEVVSKKILTHNYELCCDGQTLIRVDKESLTYAKTYEINIAQGVDEHTALAVVLAINTVATIGNDSVGG